MAFLDKQYIWDKDDNFDGFLKAAGLPDEQIQKYLSFKATSKLVKNGDTYTFITARPDGVKETSFKSGVEFEDTINSIPIKNTIIVNGNNVDQVIKTDKGNASFKREYVGDQLIVTITASIWDGVAKRYYKAA